MESTHRDSPLNIGSAAPYLLTISHSSAGNLYPLYFMGTSKVSALFTDTALPYFFQLQDLLIIHSTPSIIQIKQRTIKKVNKKTNIIDAT